MGAPTVTLLMLTRCSRTGRREFGGQLEQSQGDETQEASWEEYVDLASF